MSENLLTQEVPTSHEVFRLFSEAVRLDDCSMLKDFDGVEGWVGHNWQLIRHEPSGVLYKLKVREIGDGKYAPASVQRGYLEWVGTEE